MRGRLSWFLFVVLACSGTYTWAAQSGDLQSPAPTKEMAKEGDVRMFMTQVAHDVTQEGPVAWIKYFDDSPAFFMAVNGHLAFPDSDAAAVGTREFARTVKHIELIWGDDLRVDPLTADLAAVAVSWREIQIDNAGHRVEESGFFTGLVESRAGRWRFRNAHWSSPVSPPTR
jgi:hypothetical protein